MKSTTHKSERWMEPDKQDLSMAVANMLNDPSPQSRVRTIIETGGSLDRSHVQRASAAGYYVRMVSGESLARACIVAEQWGRVLAPEPWLEANIVVDTLLRSGSAYHRERIVPDLLRGRQIATWAGNDLPGFWGRDPFLRVDQASDGFVLNGRVSAVLHAGDADWILLAARDEDSVSQFLVSASEADLHRQRLDGLDITRPRYDIVFDNTHVPGDAIIGRRRGATPDIDREVQIAIPLALSQTLGAMHHLVEQAIAHAKSRIAFGRPIGSFQAVKHLLVDASLGVQMSAALCDAAAAAVDASDSDATEIASMAKSFVSRTGIDVAHAVWQVFGGMAYMWQNDFHLYLRRITADAAFLGTADWHNERICMLHGLKASQSSLAQETLS